VKEGEEGEPVAGKSVAKYGPREWNWFLQPCFDCHPRDDVFARDADAGSASLICPHTTLPPAVLSHSSIAARGMIYFFDTRMLGIEPFFRPS
jgi:hypothetical protein